MMNRNGYFMCVNPLQRHTQICDTIFAWLHKPENSHCLKLARQGYSEVDACMVYRLMYPFENRPAPDSFVDAWQTCCLMEEVKAEMEADE